MKTAISIEERLLDEADRAARQMHLSRSRLFSLAIEDYLRRRRGQEILDQLNRVYEDDQQGERDGAAQMKNTFRRVTREKW